MSAPALAANRWLKVEVVPENSFIGDLVLELAHRTSLAGLPSRVTALPYANYKTKSEQLHFR